jgi:methyltransferase (TIGR00027 family)
VVTDVSGGRPGAALPSIAPIRSRKEAMSNTLQASRTAVLVCQGRAAAHGRIAVGRFDDPTAMALLRSAERETVQRVRDGAVPGPWPQRVDYETVKANAELMAPRTVAIDDAVRAHPAPQVVILGAGLDGRAWRLPELAGRSVFEVDQPASQRDKRDRAAALPGAPPVFVPVDFGRDRLGAALADAGHVAGEPTTWIWEGVVPYLTAAEVEDTAGEVAARSAPGSRLIVNYQTSMARLGRLVVRAMTASGRSSVWTREPWRSAWTPSAMAGVLARHGFAVARDDDLAEVAGTLGMPVLRRRTIGRSRVAVADRI